MPPAEEPIVVSAATVDDYKDKISDLEEEKKEIERELANLKSDKKDQKAEQTALQRKIDNLQSQINICNNQLSKHESDIEQLNADIAAKQKELEDTKYIFRQRIRAIYMSGGMTASSLTVLLSAEDLSDLLIKTQLTQSISAYDKSLIEKIGNDVNTINTKKAEIDKLIKEQEAIKATLKDKKSELDSDIKKVNSVISGLNSDINKLNNQADKLDAAIKEYEQAIKDAQNVGKDQVHSGKFIWPCPGYRTITSPYGYRKHPISGKRKLHKGIDISGGGIKGKPIVAAADGVVSIAKYNSGGYGWYVMINHGEDSKGDAYSTLYAHMTKYIVSYGQTVKKGQTIGYVGTSGASTGYHLHFEIRVNGEAKNPMNYY